MSKRRSETRRVYDKHETIVKPKQVRNTPEVRAAMAEHQAGLRKPYSSLRGSPGGTPAPAPTPRQLLFALDTAIRLPSGPFDASKGSKIEYTVRNDNTAANADIWGTDTGANYGRMRTGDFRSFRGSSGGNIGAIAHVQGVQYDATEEVVTPGTCTVTFDGLGSGDANVGATGVDTGPWQIGGRASGQGIIGVIKDFKIYNEVGTLIHHWPINDDVADGGEITDIVGGLNGTLVLGAGQWEDAP
jgi:hypothetical protein